ncbi:MAG TPA: glycosyl hydrolase family 28-related protein, partial [Kofleriaceae bacterium]|nr:glycosyl hydrolase family 28-related protein [Kofleriaceae bacterium]
GLAGLGSAGCRPQASPASTGAPRAAAGRPDDPSSGSAAHGVSVSVKDHGAKGDGATDDREAIQAAIGAVAAAGGGEVYLPPGTYVVSGARHAFWALDVPGGVHLRGAGQDKTTLQQAPGAGPSVRLLHLSGAHITLEDLALDGNKAAQTKNPQRHGIFTVHTEHLIVRRVAAHDFTGDGFYLYDGAADSQFIDVVATGNDRNGLTLGGNVDGTTLFHSKFAGNRAQQVDSEPGGTSIVSHTLIAGCEIDVAGASNDYALTVSGTEHTKGHDWTIVGNRIHGGIFVVWAERVLIAGNTGTNPTTKASVSVYRTSNDVVIAGNRFEMTQTRVRSLAGVLVQGTGTGSAPDRVFVLGNELTLDYEQSFGIRAEGAISVTLRGNTLRGPGRSAPGYAGIYVRATNQAEDFRSASVVGNTVRNFGARGVSLVGTGTAKLLSVEIRDNTFDDDAPVPAMTSGISLDDGTGAARQVRVTGNRFLHGVTAPLINYPADRQAVTSDAPPSAPAPPSPTSAPSPTPASPSPPPPSR